MSRHQSTRSMALGILAVFFLLGASPCSVNYPASRACSALSMQVTIAQPGVLVPDCLGTSPMEITFRESITFPTLPPQLTTSIVQQRFGNRILITPNITATPGVTTVVLHTAPLVAGIQPSTYTIRVTIVGVAPPPPPPPDAGPPPPSGDPCPLTPPPAPGGSFVTATATPAVVPESQSVRLSEVITRGVGPFSYAWRGYADRGAPVLTLSASSSPAADPTLASPLVQLSFPDEDFYFFVDVTDQGVAPSDPNRVLTGCVRVHESSGPLARFTASPSTFEAGTHDVTLDPSGSTGLAVPLDWEVDYFGDVQPPPATLEDFLKLPEAGWSFAFSEQTGFLPQVVPASVFAQPGAYRASLRVTDPSSAFTHFTFAYLQVTPGAAPPDAGPADAGAPDAGPPDAGPPPASPVATVTADGDVVPQGGSILLNCSAAGGVGPVFDYAWHGYRDDGAPGPGPFTLSGDSGPSVVARLVFPTSDFYFFCVVTDHGVALNDPNRTFSSYVKLHESDGPVARFTVAPGPFHSGVDDVLVDASASTGYTTPVTWTVEHYIGTATPGPGIEGYLSLYDPVHIVWAQIYTTDSLTPTLTFSAATFPSDGIYRVRLDVFDSVFNSHTVYQYFTILP